MGGARGHLEPVQLVVKSRFQAEQRLLLLAQLLQPAQHLDPSSPPGRSMMTPPPRYRKGKSGLGGAGGTPLPTGACARFPFVDVNSWLPKLGCKSKTSKLRGWELPKAKGVGDVKDLGIKMVRYRVSSNSAEQCCSLIRGGYSSSSKLQSPANRTSVQEPYWVEGSGKRRFLVTGKGFPSRTVQIRGQESNYFKLDSAFLY